MTDVVTLQTRLEAIEAILAGPSSLAKDGQSVTYDFVSLRAERSRIERQIAQINGTKPSVRRGRYNEGRDTWGSW